MIWKEKNPFWKRYQPSLFEINTYNLNNLQEVISIEDGNFTGPEPWSGKQYFGTRCPGQLRFHSEPLEIYWDPTILTFVTLDPICDLTFAALGPASL